MQGNVYGIWINEENISKKALWKQMQGKTKLNSIDELKIISEEWYPLYRGKDKKGAERIFAHMKGHKNGNINLPQYEILKDQKIIFEAITVSCYADFERNIFGTYPSLLGSPQNAREGGTLY